VFCFEHASTVSFPSELKELLPFLKILELEGSLARSYFELMCVGAIGQNRGGAQRWPSVLGA
jgi:hypothetical protein